MVLANQLPSLKRSANSKAPENGWSENDRFLLGFGLFQVRKAVRFSGRACSVIFQIPITTVMVHRCLPFFGSI